MLNPRVISSLERMPVFRKNNIKVGKNTQRHMFIHNDKDEVVCDQLSPSNLNPLIHTPTRELDDRKSAAFSAIHPRIKMNLFSNNRLANNYNCIPKKKEPLGPSKNYQDTVQTLQSKLENLQMKKNRSI